LTLPAWATDEYPGLHHPLSWGCTLLIRPVGAPAQQSYGCLRFVFPSAEDRRSALGKPTPMPKEAPGVMTPPRHPQPRLPHARSITRQRMIHPRHGHRPLRPLGKGTHPPSRRTRMTASIGPQHLQLRRMLLRQSTQDRYTPIVKVPNASMLGRAGCRLGWDRSQVQILDQDLGTVARPRKGGRISPT